MKDKSLVVFVIISLLVCGFFFIEKKGRDTEIVEIPCSVSQMFSEQRYDAAVRHTVTYYWIVADTENQSVKFKVSESDYNSTSTGEQITLYKRIKKATISGADLVRYKYRSEDVTDSISFSQYSKEYKEEPTTYQITEIDGKEYELVPKGET